MRTAQPKLEAQPSCTSRHSCRVQVINGVSVTCSGTVMATTCLGATKARGNAAFTIMMTGEPGGFSVTCSRLSQAPSKKRALTCLRYAIGVQLLATGWGTTTWTTSCRGPSR